MVRQPAPEDQYSCGFWTVGWTGTEPLGSPSRPALDPWQCSNGLAELGACPEKAAERDYGFVPLSSWRSSTSSTESTS